MDADKRRWKKPIMLLSAFICVNLRFQYINKYSATARSSAGRVVVGDVGVQGLDARRRAFLGELDDVVLNLVLDVFLQLLDVLVGDDAGLLELGAVNPDRVALGPFRLLFLGAVDGGLVGHGMATRAVSHVLDEIRPLA